MKRETEHYFCDADKKYGERTWSLEEFVDHYSNTGNVINLTITRWRAGGSYQIPTRAMLIIEKAV